uniref:Gustatory receptor n=1 Tax=Culicoides sonorensis TaxID=179676 RepID=A0A336KC35_CULSO
MSKMYYGNKKAQATFWHPISHVGTWRPLFYMIKLFGYAPVTETKNGFITSSSDLILPIIAFIFYIALLVLAYITTFSNYFIGPLTDSKILDIGLNISVVLCDITAAVIVVSNYINRLKISEIIAAIESIDTQLIKLGWEANYRRDLMINIMHIGISMIGQLILYGITYFLREKYQIGSLTYPLIALYGAVTLAYTIYMTNFIFVMLTIQKRYKAINQTMKRYFVKKPFALTPGLGHVCTKLAKLHDYLGDNVDAVNETLAFQINAPVANAFIFTVFCIFQLFHLMKGSSNVGMALMAFIWNIYYTAFVIGVFYIASKLTNTGKKTATIVHRAINLSPNSENVDKLRVFSQQLLHRPPIVTSGFFDYNWELFFGLLGSGTMYLIILIQFDT